MPGIRPIQEALFFGPASRDERPMDLSSRLAPPYDITDVALAQRLVQADVHCAAVLESPRSVFSDQSVDEAHRRARKTLDEWIADGTLRTHPRPACVVTRLTFLAGDSVHRRMGLTALVPVAPADSTDNSSGGLLDHEERSPHLENNRYKHINALRCQTSPILVLYDDQYGDVETCLRTHIINREPTYCGQTCDGVVHEAWIMDDAHEIHLLEHAFGLRPLVIADGHNRYKAHLRYLNELNHTSPTHPARWCAANLVAQQDDGLSVRSMYHVFSGIRDYDFETLLTKAATRAEIHLTEVPLAGLLARVERAWLAGSHPVGIHDMLSGRSAVLTTRQVDPLASEHESRPEAWRRADPVILEYGFVRPILQDALNAGQPVRRRAFTEADRVNDSGCESESPQLAAVVLPVSAATIVDLASIHCFLPPCTAQFWPTVPAGLVFHSLE